MVFFRIVGVIFSNVIVERFVPFMTKFTHYDIRLCLLSSICGHWITVSILIFDL